MSAPILCCVCEELFTARIRKERPLPDACSQCTRFRRSQKLRGIIPVHAVDGKQRKALERARLLLQAAFGAITDRDVAVFERGRKFGYSQGYNKMYARY